MDALEMVQKHGAMIKSPNGYPVQSPCLSHLNKPTGIMMRIARSLGLPPPAEVESFCLAGQIRRCSTRMITTAGQNGKNFTSVAFCAIAEIRCPLLNG
jgi:phage terminase small subunit